MTTRDDALRKARKCMTLIRASAPEAANCHVVLAGLVRRYSLEWAEYGGGSDAAAFIVPKDVIEPRPWARQKKRKGKKYGG